MLLIGVLVVILLAAAPILAIISLIRTRRLGDLPRRIATLEERLQRLESSWIERRPDLPIAQAVPAPDVPRPIETAAVTPKPPAPADEAARIIKSIVEPQVRATPGPKPRPSVTPSFDWEMFIGRRALGWIAVVSLLFGSAFFVRYAFEHQWIGPLGRISMGLIAGLALVMAGWRQWVHGARSFSHMLSAAGIVLLYLATFSAFGFYHLIGQREASVFLLLIVVESALLALAYDALGIALMTVIGGLLTPILMRSDHDQYQSLFVYLVVINAGAVGLLLRRRWLAVGTVALVGTQALFWSWYFENYHPEKFAWAIGFQLAIYLLYVGHSLLAKFVRRQAADWEDVARLILTAGFWFGAAYVLMQDNYAQWTGSLAVLMAGVYAAIARAQLISSPLALRWGGTLVPKDPTTRLMLAALAVAASFLALAMPIQADAPWVALGWAAEAAVLWWFGLRIQAPPLRAFGAVLAALAVLRTVGEMPPVDQSKYRFLFNKFAIPALSVAACLLVGLAGGARWLRRVSKSERGGAAVGVVVCLLLVAWVISVDLVRYCNLRHDSPRLAQMSLSAWWAVYATALLVIGFVKRHTVLRCTALGLYALTIAKVFLFDMSGLDQIFRIVAFFVLAIVLGLAAWIYQRIQPDKIPAAVAPEEN